MQDSHSNYFIPDPSHWPIVGSIALFTSFIGAALLLNGVAPGILVLILGFAATVIMFYGWFADVIAESIRGKYNKQVDVSFRWGMSWFIFSEVMFFAAFFGALYYARVFSVPWLGGDGSKLITHDVLWPSFEAIWPLLKTPDATLPDLKTAYTQIKNIIPAWGVPAVNTVILLSSGATVTFAHWALKKGNRSGLSWWLFATVVLGFLFVYLQAMEYVHAYHELDLKLTSGVYGSTFFMLTGFHGFHVTMGATMLTVILLRSLSGHFSAHNHFAFEGVAWYWHFVDVVWLGLFIFVYWM
jgi:Heme/copper-type cytochrome/quinol oxidase, subunit 3